LIKQNTENFNRQGF